MPELFTEMDDAGFLNLNQVESLTEPGWNFKTEAKQIKRRLPKPFVDAINCYASPKQRHRLLRTLTSVSLLARNKYATGNRYREWLERGRLNLTRQTRVASSALAAKASELMRKTTQLANQRKAVNELSEKRSKTQQDAKQLRKKEIRLGELEENVAAIAQDFSDDLIDFEASLGGSY